MKSNYCGREAQERMIRNGWRLEVPSVVKSEGDAYSHIESEDELYERLSEKWADVRIYWTGSCVRGIHNHFAMCKGRKA